MEINIGFDAVELEKLATVCGLHKKGHADLMVARMVMGRLCSEVILSRLDKGYQPKGSRGDITDYFRRVMPGMALPGLLIAVYRIVELLGDGEYGTLAWCAAKEFYPLVECDLKTETWSVVPEFAGRAEALFRQAIAGNWTREQARQAITIIRPRLAQYRCNIKVIHQAEESEIGTNSPMLVSGKLFTTGDISSITGVATRTVSKWCDKGILPCHRIPLSNDRRISRKAFLEFVQKHSMALENTRLLGLATVLTLGVAEGHRQATETGAKGLAKVVHHDRLFALARAMEDVLAVVFVLDVSAGLTNVLDLCQGVQGESWVPQIIVLDDEIDSNEIALLSTGVNVVLRKPVAPNQLAEKVRGLLKGKLQ